MKKVVMVMSLFLALLLAFAGLAAAEEGVTDKEIVIGSHQDLSGPIAGWGILVKMGLEMRIKEINDAGGIHGRKLRIVIEDNKYDPKTAIMVTNKMMSRDKVFAFVGNMGSPTAGATKPLISRRKIPQMFPLTAASLFFEPYDRYSFGGFTPYYDQARMMIKWWKENKNVTKVGLMYQDDEMGAIMKKGVEDQLKVYGLKMVGAESYKRGATEFSSQIAKLKKAGPQLVILATIIRETVGALKEAKKIQWTDVRFAGLTPTFTKWVPALCLKSGFSADGFYSAGQAPYIYPDSPIESVREFWKRHVAMFGKDPDVPTTAGYSGIEMFRTGAERAGKNLTREKFVDELEKFKDEPDKFFGGVPLTFTKKSHQGAFGGIIQIVKNDKYEQVEFMPGYE